MSQLEQPGGQFLVYADVDGRLKIDVRLDGETVWLTQQGMADLFQTSVPNISMHIKNVYDEGELGREATDPDQIIHERADADHPNMGLTTWRGPTIRKNDVGVAKNYLNKDELTAVSLARRWGTTSPELRREPIPGPR